MSNGERCRPVTRSRAFGRGTDSPMTCQSATDTRSTSKSAGRRKVSASSGALARSAYPSSDWPGACDDAVTDCQRVRFDVPLAGGVTPQQFACRRGALSNSRDRVRRSTASGRYAVIRDQFRVGHDEADTVGSNVQLFSSGLCDLGAGALTFLDLTRHDGNAAVGVKLYAGGGRSGGFGRRRAGRLRGLR